MTIDEATEKLAYFDWVYKGLEEYRKQGYDGTDYIISSSAKQNKMIRDIAYGRLTRDQVEKELEEAIKGQSDNAH